MLHMCIVEHAPRVLHANECHPSSLHLISTQHTCDGTGVCVGREKRYRGMTGEMLIVRKKTKCVFSEIPLYNYYFHPNFQLTPYYFPISFEFQNVV